MTKDLLEKLNKLKVGDKVTLKKVGNGARGYNMSDIDSLIKEGYIVSKVGRKYITVKNDEFSWSELQFEKAENYREYIKGGYSPNYKLYTCKEDILKEQETEKLYCKIKRSFDSYSNNEKLSLEQLERINTIIEE